MHQTEKASINLLLFDVGGVLVQTIDESFRSEWEDRLNMPRGSLEAAVHGTELFRQLERDEISIKDFWQRITSKLGVPQDEIEQFRKDFYAGDLLNEELIEHIRQWRKAYRIGIISNTPISLRENLTNHFGIADLFEHIIASSEVRVRKPDARIYNFALEAFQANADQALFVDDVPANIEGAEAVGIHGVLYINNDQTVQKINELLFG